MKLILDTNIWISFLLGKSLSILTEIFKRNDIEIYVSEQLIKEIKEVAHRSKIAKLISSNSFENLLDLINVRCKMISSDAEGEFDIRDTKDIYILRMAKNVLADYIITGDKDLLVLKNFQVTKIITFTEFKELYFN